MKSYNVPGLSVAVIDQGKIKHVRGYGLIEKGLPEPVSADTLFQAASISKTVTALASMYLVQIGMLDLDEDVNKKLLSWQVPDNELTNTQRVTLRRLLSHSAGINVSGFPGYRAGSQVPTTIQVLDGIEPANTEPVRVCTVPGTIFSYSGGGFTVAQLLLADTCGMPFPELMQHYLFEKLGLNHSTFQLPLPADLSAPVAMAHTSDGEPLEGKYHIYPEMAAAGLWTTPSDLAQVAITIRNSALGISNDYLIQQSAIDMLTPPIPKCLALGMGILGSDKTRHFLMCGCNEGFRCKLMMYLDSGQGAVVMTNGENGGDLCEEITQDLAQTYRWPT